jgi:hypothetical protein
MDAVVNHIESYLGLYSLLGILLLGAGGFFAFDARSARRRRGAIEHNSSPDHTRSVHTHDPWAGMNESGPKI